MSIDPAVAQTGQPYAYTGDDPLNATDPLGFRPWYRDKNLPRWLRGAQSQKLRDIIDGQYRGAPRGGVRIGDGGAADMLRAEAADVVRGENWNGELRTLQHYQKVEDDLNGVKSVIRNPLSSQADIQVGRRLAGTLESALNEARAASVAARTNAEEYLGLAMKMETQVGADAASIGNAQGAEAADAEVQAIEGEEMR